MRELSTSQQTALVFCPMPLAGSNFGDEFRHLRPNTSRMVIHNEKLNDRPRIEKNTMTYMFGIMALLSSMTKMTQHHLVLYCYLFSLWFLLFHYVSLNIYI